jgi:hypothetical protein
MLNSIDDSIEQGKRLKAARKLTLLSRRSFAVKYHFNASSYQAWEDGKYKKGLSLAHAEKIIKALVYENIDCSLEWLVFGNGSVATRKKEVGNILSNEPDDLIRQKTHVHKKILNLNNQLIHAIKNNKIETCRRLLVSGANLHTLSKLELYLYSIKQLTALHFAAQYAGALLVKMFIKLNLNPNIRNRDEDTPLHVAAFEGNTITIKKLVEYGASIDATNNEGTTPVMWAAQKGQCSAVELLISLGAHVNYADYRENTALHWAAFHGRSASIKTLYDHGAFLDAKNIEGKTPLDIAITNGQIDAVESILSIRQGN